MAKSKSNEIRIKNLITKIILFVSFLLFIWFTFIFIPGINSTLFTFTLIDNWERIDGEVYFDDVFFGETQNGEIRIYSLENIPKEISFKGNYKDSNFEIKYYFPSDYLDYSEVPFSFTKEDIKNSKVFLEEDAFSHTDEPHWNHMPLTYNYNKKCEEFSIISSEGKGRYVVKIETGLEYIEDETNGAITFKKENSTNVDIMFYCDFTKESQIPFSISINGVLQSDTLATSENSYFEGTNLFKSSEIHFIKTYGCPAGTLPVDVIHEVSHSLGLKHNENPAVILDIMNPREQDCNKARFLKKDLEYLWEIYDPNNVYKPYKTKYNCLQSYYTCLDFTTQSKAQEVLEFCEVEEDIHDLDEDKDGLACENLP